MSFHTARSPSQTKRFLSCAGALALCEALPDHQKNISGYAAQLGTATHGLVERCLSEGSEPSAYEDRIIELVGEEQNVSILKPNAKTPGPGRTFFIIDADVIDAATAMTDYVRSRCKELGVAESELQLETRTNPLPERDDTSGTADVTIDAFDVLEVPDYKNGYNVVEADSEQLRSYLLGKAIDTGWNHSVYMVTVVQPNADHIQGRIRSCEYTKADLLKYQKQLRAGIKRNEDAELDSACPDQGFKTVDEDWAASFLVAGDHCMFCDAQARCPARQALAQEAAGIDFNDEPAEIEFERSEEEIARIMRWIPILDQFKTAVVGYAQRALENGYEVEGQKLVQRGAHRKWKSEPTPLTAKAIAKRFKLAVEKLFEKPSLKSGPQIEKMIPAKRRQEFSDAYLFKPEGVLTIAPVSDPRPAVNRSAGDDFADDLEDPEDFG